MSTDDDMYLDPDDQESEFLHVIPCFGKEHASLTTCWCRPEPLPDDPCVWVHNPEQ